MARPKRGAPPLHRVFLITIAAVLLAALAAGYFAAYPPGAAGNEPAPSPEASARPDPSPSAQPPVTAAPSPEPSDEPTPPPSPEPAPDPSGGPSPEPSPELSPEPSAPANTRLYILMYHHFVPDGEDCNDWTTTVSHFREDLEWLRDNGYTCVLPRELAAGQPLPEKAVMLTMLKSTVEEYRAMFRRAGFRLQVLTPVECAYGALLAAREKRTGRSGEDCCIVRLGHSTSDLYLYRGAEFDSRREIDIGSARLDELISEQYGVDVHVARGYRQHNYNGVLQSDYAQELYSRLSVEVVKAVNFYNYNNRDRELKNVYFCGDGSLAGVRRAVSENTRLTVCPAEELLPEGAHTDDPWVYLCAIGSVNEGIQGGLE